jgi:ribosomal protein L31
MDKIPYKKIKESLPKGNIHTVNPSMMNSIKWALSIPHPLHVFSWRTWEETNDMTHAECSFVVFYMSCLLFQNGNGMGLLLHFDNIPQYRTVPAKDEKKVTHVCQVCGNTYKTGSNLRRHQRIHSGKMITCNICQKQFTDRFDLKRHITHIHEGISYRCTDCSRSYTSKSSLQQHLEVYHKKIYR